MTLTLMTTAFITGIPHLALLASIVALAIYLNKHCI